MKILITLLVFLVSFSVVSTKTPSNAVLVTYKVSHSEIKPGDTLLVEFTFKLKKGWHIYWLNPGDAGLPTVIEPKENSFGYQYDVLMQVPKILKEEDLVFYCFENKTTMVSRFIIAKNAEFAQYNLEYDISWLMCKNECYPGKINFKIPITISTNSKTINKIKLDQYPKTNFLDYKYATIIDNSVKFSISSNKNSKLEFFPLTPGYFVYNLININKTKKQFQITLPLDKFRENDPEEIEGLVVFRNKKNKVESYFSKIFISK